MSPEESIARQPEPQEAPSVWIVEDQRILRESLIQVIRGSSRLSCPFAFASCEEFLHALEVGEIPDMVLMDIGLPGKDGIEGIRRLQSLSPSSRSIVHTIHDDDEKVFEAICAGASGYLLKPSEPLELVEALLAVHRGASPINPYIARKVLTFFAQSGSQPKREDEYGLSAREREILGHLVAGLKLREIAELVHLSYHTVSNHVRNIYAKLHVRTRSKAVAKAIREDLL